MMIVGVCVAVYLLAAWMVFDKKSISDLLVELKASGGGHARAHVALQLAQELRRAKAHDTPVEPEVVPQLIDILESTPAKDFQTRWYIAHCLGHLADPRAVPGLVRVMESDDNPETIAACLNALGAISDSSAAPSVIRLLDHPSTIVRKYAVFNLGALAKKPDPESPPRYPAAIEFLKEKLNDSSAEVRWNAACSLALFLHDRSGLRVLRQMLDRKYVEKTIGRDPQKNNLTRHAMKMSCASLWTLKDRESLDLLNRVGRKDPDYEVRKAALDAAREIAKK